MTPAPSPPTEPPPARRAWLRGTLLWSAAARGIALFIAFFSLLNLLIEYRTPAFDANQWWIDFRPLPAWVGTLFLVISAGVLLGYCFAPLMGPVRRRITLTTCEFLGLFAIWNVLVYYVLLARGTLYSGIFLPFSALVLIALFIVWRGVARREQSGNGVAAWVGIMGTLGLCAFAVPLGQMVCYGTTDYRRPAEAIIVFGARIQADASPSEALQDRIDLAVELYNEKLAPKLILTGAQGPDEPLNEAEVMRRMAINAGVAPGDIQTDPGGFDTAASVNETGIMLRDIAESQSEKLQGRPVRVLIVSHFYHLPRIKMEYQREQIPPYYWQLYTVPVRSPLARLPWYMGREVAAQWAYYLGPLLRGE